MKLAVCKTERERLASFSVRSIVFIDEQIIPHDEEFDEHDEPGSGTINIVGWDGDDAVAASRIRIVGDIAKLERICIRKQWRGGHGHRLVKFMLDTASAQGVDRFTLHAQAHLTGFYEKHGFTSVGEIFSEAGIDHQRMDRN
jgi:predicted GNAT family N-acyltransferase